MAEYSHHKEVLQRFPKSSAKVSMVYFIAQELSPFNNELIGSWRTVLACTGSKMIGEHWISAQSSKKGENFIVYEHRGGEYLLDFAFLLGFNWSKIQVRDRKTQPIFIILDTQDLSPMHSRAHINCSKPVVLHNPVSLSLDGNTIRQYYPDIILAHEFDEQEIHAEENSFLYAAYATLSRSLSPHQLLGASVNRQQEKKKLHLCINALKNYAQILVDQFP